MADAPGASARARDNALIGRLQQVPLFHRMSVRHLQVLRKVARPLSLQKGDVLIPEGSREAGIFLLLKGSLAIARDSPDVRVMEALAAAGEVAELSGQPQRQEVSVAEAGVALHLAHDGLVRLFDRDADLYERLCRNLVAHLSARLVAANQLCAELSRSRDELMQDLRDAESELNDARLLSSMR